MTMIDGYLNYRAHATDDDTPFADEVDDPAFAEAVSDEPIWPSAMFATSDGNALVAGAVENPDAHSPRLVLADWFAEQGDFELGEVMRDGVVGVRCLRRTKNLMEKLKRPATVRLLWAAAFVLDVNGADVPGLSYISGTMSAQYGWPHSYITASSSPTIFVD